MKTSFLIIIFSVLGVQQSFAADSAAWIKYGNALCDDVTFSTSREQGCKDWVLNNFDVSSSGHTVFSFATNICESHNFGPSSRSVSCYELAAKMIQGTSQIALLTQGCTARGTYSRQLSCLAPLWRGEHTKELQKQQQPAKADKVNFEVDSETLQESDQSVAF